MIWTGGVRYGQSTWTLVLSMVQLIDFFGHFILTLYCHATLNVPLKSDYFSSLFQLFYFSNKSFISAAALTRKTIVTAVLDGVRTV